MLVTSVRDYINRMLQDISGMKVLILDSETVKSDLFFFDYCFSDLYLIPENLGTSSSLHVFYFIFVELQVSNVSIVYSQSELLQKEVFLVEMIDSISVSKESMSHLKAVYFIRPTSENIQKLRYQLAHPRFGEYHLCMVLHLLIISSFVIVHWQL